jgi:hypothetical protein
MDDTEIDVTRPRMFTHVRNTSSGRRLPSKGTFKLERICRIKKIWYVVINSHCQFNSRDFFDP